MFHSLQTLTVQYVPLLSDTTFSPFRDAQKVYQNGLQHFPSYYFCIIPFEQMCELVVLLKVSIHGSQQNQNIFEFP